MSHDADLTADEMRERGIDPVDRAACEHGGLLLTEDPDVYDCTEGCGDEGPKLWNVVVAVIANLPAASGSEAYDRLAGAVRAAGFDIYEEHGHDPFEAEDGTEETQLPLRGM